jgi:hypothetical protein
VHWVRSFLELAGVGTKVDDFPVKWVKRLLDDINGEF